MQEVQGTLNEILINIGIACLTLAGTYATFYLRKLTQKLKLEAKKIEDDQQKAFLMNALSRFDDVATKTVSALEQQAAEMIRKDLTIDAVQKKKKLSNLASEAYRQILSTLEPEYVRALRDSLGDFEGYVLNTIEDKVRIIKKE